MTTLKDVELLVRLAPPAVLAQLPHRMQRLVALRYPRDGHPRSNAEVCADIYPREVPRDQVERLTRRIEARLWKLFLSYHPPKARVSYSSPGKALTGCTHCGRLVSVYVRHIMLPSQVYAVCAPCRAEGYHPMRLFPNHGRQADSLDDEQVT